MVVILLSLRDKDQNTGESACDLNQPIAYFFRTHMLVILYPPVAYAWAVHR